jgi:hypothetical protein
MIKHTLWKLLSLLAVHFVLAPQPAHPRLRKLVGVAGENGVVALNGNKLSLFSPANIRIQDPTSPQWRLADTKSGAVSIRAHGAHWQELPTPLPVSAAYSFAFCDPLNQVNLRSTDVGVRSVLPASARVKSIIRVSDDLNFVIYSASANTVTYDVRVGLVENKKTGGYSLLDDQTATDAGTFCGVQRGNEGIFFVFGDEPSGSSDFSAVYVYTIVGSNQDQ